MSAGLAAWIAHLVFWLLLLFGWMWDDLGARGIAAFVLLWIAGFWGLQYFPLGPDMFFSYVAVLDVVLVFLVFKGDVRLS
jgi:hypothetical protein